MVSYTQIYTFHSSMTLMRSVWLTGWLTALFYSSPINAIALNISQSHSANLRYLLTNEEHRWSFNTSINFAGSSDFFASTERWTTFSAPTYAAVISPGTEEDVAKIIKLATMHNIPLLATGARHGYTITLGELHNGLAIDLSHFKEFELDEDAKTLTVGPGVTVGEIFDPLFSAGFEIQTGSAPCPSFIGVTLGGGVGRFQGVYGLLSDALISVRLITANGEVLEVSRNRYPDLFWAIRGAGANFGVATSATYSVHPLTNNGDMFIAEFIVPPRRWSEYLRKMESMSPLPAELSSLLLNSFNTTTNQTQLYAHWAYKGTETDARKHLSPILNMNLTATQMRVLPWNRLVENTFAGAAVTVCEPNTNRNLYTLSMRNYSASTWEAVSSKLATFYTQYPQARSSSLLYEFFPNQAMAAIPQDETAFPRRDTTAYINLILTSSIHNSEIDNALARFGEEIRRDVAATSGYPEITTFVNYAHGDETLGQIYGKNKLARLAALKKIWDPKEVFSFNNGLPTRYP
ncbi:related to 6-hydroxy-D-nicotine oxidase [Fusarium proliferatum]|nr:related to 6-hydroxy-D-nicotine oxidase [Fusarium proliferatum]